jgi:hypothetical protein
MVDKWPENVCLRSESPLLLVVVAQLVIYHNVTLEN